MHSADSEHPSTPDDAGSEPTARRLAPATIEDLFGLYYERYKPLYSYVQVLTNQIPAELAFEIQAAWDHVSRHYQFNEPLDRCLDLAARHVKRAILDSYKLVVRYTLDEYEELRRIDLSIVDNGDFDRKLRQLITEIRTGATDARGREGDTTHGGDWHSAFELWDLAFSNCQKFHRDFYLNKNVDWARRKQLWKRWWQRGEGFVLGVLASLAAAALWQWFATGQK